ncbi:MAG: hypothetical protein RBT61_12885 [Candidatus Kapabacteria bacterium]|jgi:hypothetical protein|nr:hypothetical protein [Candidatus Kapabacteria bacterium]
METISSIGQVLIGLAALLISIANLIVLRRMNIVDSKRRVNDKYTELNILELQNEGLIPFNHLFPQKEGLDIQKEIENYKRTNMLFNHINVLEGIFVEMKYKTMRKKHALQLLDWFCPQIINHPEGNYLIKNSGYDEDFVKFCIKYEKE